jgi:hypothetical protein
LQTQTYFLDEALRRFVLIEKRGETKVGFTSLLKDNGILTNAINSYLLQLQEENDRRSDVYSPSLISNGCLIALILDKLGYKRTARVPDVKTKRIFHNGDKTHERLQDYAVKSGIAKFIEVAVKHPTCGMYGTCDLVLYLDRLEEIVLGELKTINTNSFENDLKGGALPNHVSQITMYVGMMELRRQHLRRKYKTEDEFYRSIAERIRFYRNNYFDHIRDGQKYTRQQKLQHLIRLALAVDELLWKTKKPITRFTILYENKNNQEFKEFEYQFDQKKFDEFVQLCEQASEWLDKHYKVNADNVEYLQIKKQILPKRKAEFTKSCKACRNCPFNEFCYTHIEAEDKKREKEKKKDKTKNALKSTLKSGQKQRRTA